MSMEITGAPLLITARDAARGVKTTYNAFLSCPECHGVRYQWGCKACATWPSMHVVKRLDVTVPPLRRDAKLRLLNVLPRVNLLVPVHIVGVALSAVTEASSTASVKSPIRYNVRRTEARRWWNLWSGRDQSEEPPTQRPPSQSTQNSGAYSVDPDGLDISRSDPVRCTPATEDRFTEVRDRWHFEDLAHDSYRMEDNLRNSGFSYEANRVADRRFNADQDLRYREAQEAQRRHDEEAARRFQEEQEAWRRREEEQRRYNEEVERRHREEEERRRNGGW